ncbi:MAG: tetratricopeptide repeat protein [Nitrospirota bacterium]
MLQFWLKKRRQTRRYSVTTAGIIIFLLTQILSCSNPVKGYVEEAERKWQRGDYAGAVIEYRKVVEKDPSSKWSEEALFWIGTAYMLHLKDVEKALVNFKKLVRLYPQGERAPEAQFYIAGIYEKEYEDYSRAIVEYQRVIESYSNRALHQQAKYRIADCYMKKGDYKRAAEEWSQFLERYPKGENAEMALYLLGSSYHALGEYAKGREVFNRLLSENPDTELWTESRLGIAECLVGEGKLKEALQILRETRERYENKDAIDIKIAAIQSRINKSNLPFHSPSRRQKK